MSRGIPDAEFQTLASLLGEGRLAELEQAARLGIARHPSDGRVWQMLGVSFLARDLNWDALAPIQRAAELMPEDYAIWDNLGLAYHRVGDYAQAETCFRRSLELQPEQLSALTNWSVTALAAGDYALAEQLARRAVRLAPNVPGVYLNLGNALNKLGDARQALACFQRSLQIEPRVPDTYLSMGIACEQIGRNQEAMACYRQAIALNPDLIGAHSNLLFLLTHDVDLEPEQVFAAHKAFGEHLEGPLKPHWRPHDNDRDPDRRIRVGFVSGDFRNHAAASFIEPLWQRVDRQRIEVVAYSNAPVEDEVSARLRELTDSWVRVTGMNDDLAAARIRADRIDILVDLSGHTAYHRLGVFARKPAPVQASWLGYPGTTGLTAIDYRPVSVFVGHLGTLADQFTEKLVYMPSSSSFMPAREAPEVGPLPALANGHVTFGSFNRPNKLGDAVIALWSRVLAAVPGSRMLVGAIDDPAMQASLAERFLLHGVAADRLEFHPRQELARYLALYHGVDIVLDSFPYTGGTTSHHALWMGVPVLTMAGRTLPQRQGAGVLARTGLEDWIAETEEQFLAKAVAAAGDLAGLAELRASLRQKMAISPLRQPADATRFLEAALRTMWRRWCDGLPPASFEIRP